jgi:tRNA threonylcarbamoyladenosine biosynthesis protein TsaE
LDIALHNLAQTHLLGKKLGEVLSPPVVLMLQGELGAGKTSLVQGLGVALGITDAIVSPTFALIQEYPEGRIPLYHFDLYRLSPSEVTQLYLETYWQGLEVSPGIVVIEWPERLSTWPERYLHLTLTYASEGRQAHLEATQHFDWTVLQNHLKTLN